MKKEDLPERWLRRLERYTDEKYGLNYAYRGQLGAGDFPPASLVHIQMPDGSQALFRYALLIEEPEWQEVAVFTEHCGYHIFPIEDTTLQRYEEKWEPTNVDA
jgi:hypothetical protein